MPRITTIHFNSGAITTYSAHEYTDLIRSILDGVSEKWLSWHGVNDIISLARAESHIIGGCETVEFLELSNGILVSSYFLDSLLVIKPSHHEGYILEVITKQESPTLYRILNEANKNREVN